MRALERNKQLVYYALYMGQNEVLDEDGNYTGEYENTYSDPVALRINVSPAYGESANEAFGTTLDYDHTLVTNDLTLPLDEHSVLWIGETDLKKPYDFVVKKVAKSLNSMLIAVKKKEVS